MAGNRKVPRDEVRRVGRVGTRVMLFMVKDSLVKKEI
jgi:hypothetical protein